MGNQQEKMIDELQASIEELYHIFAVYPLRANIEGCPCCVSDADQATLHSKELSALEEEDLSYYAFKAMTTFGMVEDFKHFLPRILELTAKRKLGVDDFVVLGKLEYGNWTTWDKIEQEAVGQFLKAWWKNAVNTESFDADLLVELHQRQLHDLPSMLQAWNLESHTQGFRNYVEFIEYHYHNLKNKHLTFKKWEAEEVEILSRWIASNAYRLEDGFFQFEQTDPIFSHQISTALYIFERLV